MACCECLIVPLGALACTVCCMYWTCWTVVWTIRGHGFVWKLDVHVCYCRCWLGRRYFANEVLPFVRYNIGIHLITCGFFVHVECDRTHNAAQCVLNNYGWSFHFSALLKLILFFIARAVVESYPQWKCTRASILHMFKFSSYDLASISFCWHSKSVVRSSMNKNGPSDCNNWKNVKIKYVLVALRISISRKVISLVGEPTNKTHHDFDCHSFFPPFDFVNVNCSRKCQRNYIHRTHT